jgi:signal peptidase II
MDKKQYLIIFLLFVSVFTIDQLIKYIFVSGFRFETQCISGVLTYNKGVAFSLFKFLGEWLKWIQISFLIGIIFHTIRYNKEFILPITLIIGAGFSNILDRFTYGGVVDYVYWHCWFDFAIFNFADVIIDLGMVWIIYKLYKEKNKII